MSTQTLNFQDFTFNAMNDGTEIYGVLSKDGVTLESGFYRTTDSRRALWRALSNHLPAHKIAHLYV